MRLERDFFDGTVYRRMYRSGNKGIDIADYLTGGDFLFLLNQGPAGGSYMLTEKNR